MSRGRLQDKAHQIRSKKKKKKKKKKSRRMASYDRGLSRSDSILAGHFPSMWHGWLGFP